jgi:hypothetical protein
MRGHRQAHRGARGGQANLKCLLNTHAWSVSDPLRISFSLSTGNPSVRVPERHAHSDARISRQLLAVKPHLLS